MVALNFFQKQTNQTKNTSPRCISFRFCRKNLFLASVSSWLTSSGIVFIFKPSQLKDCSNWWGSRKNKGQVQEFKTNSQASKDKSCLCWSIEGQSQEHLQSMQRTLGVPWQLDSYMSFKILSVRRQQQQTPKFASWLELFGIVLKSF